MWSLISGDRVGNFAVRQNSIAALDNPYTLLQSVLNLSEGGEKKKKKKRKKKIQVEKKNERKKNENAIIGHRDLCE